jgi:hypothetical protein
MKHLQASLVLLVLIIAPLAASAQLAEKDEHVDCSTADRDCHVDIVWSHFGNFIVRDWQSHTRSKTDPKHDYVDQRDVRYYDRAPSSADDLTSLKRWGVLNINGTNHGAIATNETQSIDYYDGTWYFDACYTHDYPTISSVTHMFADNVAMPWRLAQVPDGSAWQIQTDTPKDGEPPKTTYRRWGGSNHGFVAADAPFKDQSRCNDPGFPFSILKTEGKIK